MEEEKQIKIGSVTIHVEQNDECIRFHMKNCFGNDAPPFEKLGLTRYRENGERLGLCINIR